MNKIAPPEFDDYAALQSLAENKAAGSYPTLKDAVAAIHGGYLQYEEARGNALYVEKVTVSDQLASHMKAHYRSPPKALPHIASLRSSAEHLTCPMCGSFHCGTLDHILPQHYYAEFALFSRNLVPACKCNSRRQDALIGSNPNERILHPYFDECLAERLIAADFSHLDDVPRVGVRLCVDRAHPEHAAIDFHFRSIAERNGIRNYLLNRWFMLCRKPSLVVRELRYELSESRSLSDILEEERDMLDEVHQSKNNWNSIFITGLLDEEVLGWLQRKMDSPRRSPDDPLV